LDNVVFTSVEKVGEASGAPSYTQSRVSVYEIWKVLLPTVGRTWRRANYTCFSIFTLLSLSPLFLR